jgi:hypothetical protein
LPHSSAIYTHCQADAPVRTPDSCRSPNISDSEKQTVHFYT